MSAANKFFFTRESGAQMGPKSDRNNAATAAPPDAQNPEPTEHLGDTEDGPPGVGRISQRQLQDRFHEEDESEEMESEEENSPDYIKKECKRREKLRRTFREKKSGFVAAFTSRERMAIQVLEDLESPTVNMPLRGMEDSLTTAMDRVGGAYARLEENQMEILRNFVPKPNTLFDSSIKDPEEDYLHTFEKRYQMLIHKANYIKYNVFMKIYNRGEKEIAEDAEAHGSLGARPKTGQRRGQLGDYHNDPAYQSGYTTAASSRVPSPDRASQNLFARNDPNRLSGRSVASSTHIDQITALTRVMGIQYEASKDVTTFNGADNTRYPTFVKQWGRAKAKLRELGKTDAQCLAELKKCLKGKALKVVQALPDDDESLELAEKDLEEIFDCSSDQVYKIISKFHEIKPMLADGSNMFDVYTDLKAVFNTIRSLALDDKTLAAVLLITLSERKLNSHCERQWKKILNSAGNGANKYDVFNVDKFMECVRNQTRLQDKLTKKQSEKPQNKPSQAITANFFFNSDAKCPLCKNPKDHQALRCPVFNKASKEKLMEIKTQHRLCANCFEKHEPYSESCLRKNSRCPSCKRFHHEKIHFDGQKHANKQPFRATKGPRTDKEKSDKPAEKRAEESSRKEEKKEESGKSQERANLHVTLANTQSRLKGILRTVIAYAVNPDTGRKRKIRVFLDAGGDKNLVTRNTARELDLQGYDIDLTMNLAGDNTSRTTQERTVTFQLHSLDGEYEGPTIEAHTIKKIVGDMRPIKFDPREYPHLANIDFNESYPQDDDIPVHCMVGEPYFSYLQVGGPVTAELQDPAAQLTRLGWCLTGNNPQEAPGDERPNVHVNFYKVSVRAEPIRLDRFFDIEHLGISTKDNELTLEENEAVEQMKRKTVYNEEEQRYYTGILWKKDPKGILNNNKNKALGVLRAMDQKVYSKIDKAELRAMYRELVDNDYAEVVPPEEIDVTNDDDRFVYYLETHPVIREEKASTKIRLVMNAASQQGGRGGASLNSCVHTGPNLLPTVGEVLLRFRQKKHAFLLDIRKAFYSVKLHKKARDTVRWVFRDPDTGKIVVLRNTGLVMGMCTSSFQTSYCINHSAKRHEVKLPEAAKTIRKSTYMDDCSKSVTSVDSGRRLIAQINEILQSGNFKPHKFSATDPNMLADLDPAIVTDKKRIKTLGVTWDVEKDNFILQIHDGVVEKKTDYTLREILRVGASCFDPQGIMAPFILQYKFILAKVWEEAEKVKCYDDAVSTELKKAWEAWITQLPLLRNFTIPRWFGWEEGSDLYIACFGDASSQAYGAVAYSVVKDKDGNIVTQLLMSKSRNAPKELKGEKATRMQTIPRLELLASLLAARLATYVATALEIQEVKCFTDSRITLQRLMRGKNPWKQWVAKRIEEVLDLTKVKDWRFVRTAENPADLASRGCSLEDLNGPQREFWFHGPSFLKKPESEWEPQPPPVRSDEDREIDSKEERTLVTALKMTEARPTDTPEARLRALEKKFSGFEKILRITVLCGRIKTRTFWRSFTRWRNSPAEAEEEIFHFANSGEFAAAIKFWIKIAQEESFAQEKSDLKESRAVAKNSTLTKFLPELDDEELIVCSSRLKLQKETPARKALPWILPKHNSIVEKFILMLHTRALHAGPKQLLYYLNRQFVLQGGREEVRRIIHLCKTARCRNPTPVDPRMAPLPSQRIDERQPFTCVSTDMFGPFLVRHECQEKDCPHSRAPAKVYGLIFTCMATRAVHVELLEDMSTETFLQALRRMIARRGHTAYIYSDNAKSFLAAKAELNRLSEAFNWRTVVNETQRYNITWEFSDPYASHQNGVTERMIGVVKKSLKISLQNSLLTFRQLEVLLAETESMVNGRPLDYVREGDKYLPVTPAQLCLGRNIALPPVVARFKRNEEAPNFVGQWRQRGALLKSFWRRFNQDYLAHLVCTKKWHGRTPVQLQAGDVVLLKDPSMGTNEWKMARVKTLYEGKDGLVRSADVALPSGSIVRRHLSRVALLEANIFKSAD